MTSENTIKQVYKVKSAERILDILECFTFEQRDLNLSEICRKTGLHKTTAKRLSYNLLFRGYLQIDPVTKRYRLGVRLFELGGIVFASFSLRKAAARHMDRLRNETESTVILAIKMEHQLVYIDRRGGKGVIYVSSAIGGVRTLHFGMLGQVLMAYLPSEERDAILKEHPLEAHTQFSITKKTQFKKRLKEILAQGYVLEIEEAVEGTAGIAAPIRDFSGKVIAALGVAITPYRSEKLNDTDAIIDKVRTASQAISANMGYKAR